MPLYQEQTRHDGLKAFSRSADAFRVPARALAFVLAMPAAVIILAVAQPWIEPNLLFRDPTEILHGPVYIGVISTLGVLVWAATASICLFAGWLTLRLGSSPEEGQFFLASGLISALLAVDDCFRLHDWLLPKVLGVDEAAMLLIYAGVGLPYLRRHGRRLIARETALLALAVGFLGVSTVLDRAIDSATVEDSFKVMGIAAWAAFFIRRAAEIVARPTRGVESR